MADPFSIGNPNEKFQNIVDELQKLANKESASTKSTNDTYLDNKLYSQFQSGVNLVDRTPWVISTTSWLSQNPPMAIVLAANPSDVTWVMGQRTSISKNLGGTVTHAWPNLYRNTYYDEPRLTINLQSTSLIPVWSNAENKWVPSPGIVNFYQIMQLLDQPKITNDGRANLVSIQYASNMFPSITLLGQFDPRGLSFSDSSQDPNKINSWTVEFIVYDSSPRLADNFGLRTSRDDLLKKYIQDRIDNKITGTGIPKKPTET